MHRVLSFVVSVGLALAPSGVLAQAKAGPKVLQLQKKEPRVGDVEQVDMNTEMRMAFDITGPEMEAEALEMSSTEVSNYTLTVLAARKRIIEQVKITFRDAGEVSVEGGQSTRTPSPVHGKSYLAGMTRGRLVVTDANGKAVSKEEAAVVKDLLPALGKVDPLEAALPDTPIKVGDSLARFAKALQDETLAQDDPSAQVRDTRVRLAEVVQEARGPVGIFDVTTTFVIKASAESPFEMTIPLEGKMSLLADGAKLRDFSLSGPVKLVLTKELRAQGLKAEGEGAMKLLMTDPTLK
ncbi:hypothetical protein ACLESO_12165 [Pyxidicoccus sp. 3LG]